MFLNYHSLIIKNFKTLIEKWSAQQKLYSSSRLLKMKKLSSNSRKNCKNHKWMKKIMTKIIMKNKMMSKFLSNNWEFLSISLPLSRAIQKVSPVLLSIPKVIEWPLEDSIIMWGFGTFTEWTKTWTVSESLSRLLEMPSEASALTQQALIWWFWMVESK